jgi:hypothetical protein
MSNVLAEYRLESGGRWLTVIGAAGETFAELDAAMRRLHGAVDVRPRDECADGAASVVKAGGTPPATEQTGGDRLTASFSAGDTSEHLTARAAPAAAGGVAVTGPPNCPPPLELTP